MFSLTNYQPKETEYAKQTRRTDDPRRGAEGVSRYGYKKSTLEDIAGELNMTNTAMYAYATSKRDLYEQTVSYVMKRWQSGVEQAVSVKTTAQEKMAALCESALFYLAQDVEFCALLRSDPQIFPMFPTVDPFEEITAILYG